MRRSLVLWASFCCFHRRARIDAAGGSLLDCDLMAHHIGVTCDHWRGTVLFPFSGSTLNYGPYKDH